jgi:L-fuculokinase
LDRRCEIVCGIHDSNASYLKFLIGREREPFIIVSSGTWTIVMANGGELSCLKEERDMLANVNALGAPVPTARFMGGREYEAIAQGSDAPTFDGLQEVVRSGAVALPSFASAGPFSGRKGALVNVEGLSSTARASLATLYSALMTELSIEALAVRGEIFVDGPLATNPLFGPLLASITSAGAVRILAADVGSARVAAYLAGFELGAKETLTLVEPLQMPGLDAYVARWREQVAER